MSWIKRNLTFVIGGIVALALLGTAGYYIYQSWNANSDARDKLNEMYSRLDSLNKKKPAPGADQENTTAAIEQRNQLTNWMALASGYFQPIPAIPPDQGTNDSAAFRSALAITIKQLQDAAVTANVALPNSNYGFSFEVYRNQLNLPPPSLPVLAVQLGEVKAITDLLINSRVNGLDGIQRLRVSDIDVSSGNASDYLDGSAVTNEMAILTPYNVSFHSFTPEIARVLDALSVAKNCILVKAVDVQPVGAANANGGQPGGMGGPGMVPGGIPGYMPGLMAPGPVPGYNPYTRQQTPTPAPVNPRGGLPVVLKEQLLKVTLQLEVVKLLPSTSK